MDQKEEVTERAMTLPEQAKQLRITTSDENKLARAFLVKVKEVRKQIDEIFDPIVNAAWKTYKTAKGQKNKVEEAAKEAEEIIKAGLVVYEQRAEKARLAEEERLRREAEERRLEAAEAAEAEGDTEEAVRILDEPIPPEVVPKEMIKDGIHYQTVWKFRVVDLEKVPRIYMMLDEAKVGAIARTLKDQARIEGIEVYSEKIPVVRV